MKKRVPCHYQKINFSNYYQIFTTETQNVAYNNWNTHTYRERKGKGSIKIIIDRNDRRNN